MLALAFTTMTDEASAGNATWAQRRSYPWWSIL